MPSWRRVLTRLASNAEQRFEALQRRLEARLGRERLHVVPYAGFGTAEQLWLRGRVLENRRVPPAQDKDSVWRNLANTYRRFASDEVPGARVQVRLGPRSIEVVTDPEGYFEAELTPVEPLRDALWHRLELRLLDPLPASGVPASATGLVLVPRAGARRGIISDIDDTVIETGATSLLRMARATFLRNSRTRLPFPGVAAFYTALQAGATGTEDNPLFYVSSSPWNLYDMLVDFMEIRGIPAGPMLLRDWGVSRNERPTGGHRSHKLTYIQRILQRYPALPFILIGDSGQADPETYAEVAERFPGRVLAIYIRDVTRHARRSARIQELAARVAARSCVMLLVDDSLAAARHAAAQGWIHPDALPQIGADAASDSAPPDTIEQLLDEPD